MAEQVRKKVKVHLDYTVEVDVDEWAESFGCAATPTSVRADVRSYFDNVIKQSARSEDGAEVLG